jgi:hypothetical protein
VTTATFFDDVRQSIVGLLATNFSAAHPGVAIVFDNGPFEWNNPPATFVHVELEWVDGDQLFLALRPKTRYRGSVQVTVYAKTGTGTKASLNLLGWFANILEYQNAGRARLQHAKLDPAPESAKGWARQSLCVGFHADT